MSKYQKGAIVAVVSIIVAVAIIGGIFWVSNHQTEEIMMGGDTIENKLSVQQDDRINDESMNKNDETGEDSMMNGDKMMTDEDMLILQKGGYESYSVDKLSFAENGNVVLFFHASWCPYCRGTDTDLTKNISSIPSDLLILKTDYDTQTTLKQKYGVTYQHTFVQVDPQGNQIAKWSGSETLEDIVSKIK